MADELNVPTHRWYQARNHIKLPPNAVSKKWIYANGVALIDAWINSQPWGNPVPALFAAGEVGAWYDPSDLSTMFQDSAGTTPVTAVGQPVGLRLDKSKGLVLGGELVSGSWVNSVSNPFNSFSSSGIGFDATKNISGSQQQCYIGSFSVMSGRQYYFEAVVVSNTIPALNFDLSTLTTQRSNQIPVQTGSSVVTGYFTATSTQASANLRAVTPSASTGSISVSSVTVRELPGNHAYQSTPGSRAILRQVNGLYCLQYDGLDDFYVTSTITPGTDKAQVFAGVRKLSDVTTTGALVELSSDPTNLAGIFVFRVPTSAVNGQTVGFFSRGTTTVGASSSPYPAPTTFIATGLGDISGDVVTLRTNGSQVAQTTTDQGTGNYLAYPLYIGRRGGTSLPFNGYEFGLIVRFGPNLSTAQIASVEDWLNTRTGAY